MIRVLVTGAAGFLGSTLVRELCRSGYRVRAMVHEPKRPGSFPSEVETVVADICHAGQIKELTSGCEAVVHLAAKVHAVDERGVDRDYETINVEGTRHVLDAAAASGTNRVVFVSSVKVFGEETDGCVDETSSPDPQTPYGRSKWQAEQLVSQYVQRCGLTAVSLRLPMVYGPTAKGNLFRLIAAIDRGRFPPLPHLSTVRSLLHVENFVQAVLVSLRAGRFERPAYVVTDAGPYCVTDIYDWLRAGLGKSEPNWRVPLWILKGAAGCGDLLQAVTRQSFPLTSDQLNKLVGPACYSSKAISRELSYQATHSFKEAVPDLIAFYRGTTH